MSHLVFYILRMCSGK